MAKKQEDNVLKDTIKLVRSAWRHTEGIKIPLTNKKIDRIKIKKLTIELNNKLPGAVLDTIDALWPEDKPRPLLTHKKRTPTGWHMIFTLMPGCSFEEVFQRHNYFEAACRRSVFVSQKGGYLHINIPDSILRRSYPYEWDPTPYLKKMDLPFPVGYNASGQLVVEDLAKIPHIRIGGTTLRAGKSNFCHNLFISLAMLQNVKLAVIDMALLEFNYVQEVAAFAGGDTYLALMLLASLEREMNQRLEILKDARVSSIQEYNKLRNIDSPLEWIVLIIDEFASLCPTGVHLNKEEKKIRQECQTICSHIAELARKVGIHLVIAMQRPDRYILPGQLKANLPGALAFKTINRVNSEIILDSGAAADLPDYPGRAIWQVGNSSQEVQVMKLPMKQARKILNEMNAYLAPRGCNFEQSAQRLPARSQNNRCPGLPTSIKY